MSKVHAAAEPHAEHEVVIGEMYTKLLELVSKAMAQDHVGTFNVGKHTFKFTLVDGKFSGNTCVYVQCWDADVPGDQPKPRGSYGIIFSATPERRGADVRVVRYSGHNRADAEWAFLLMFKPTFKDTLQELARKLHEENHYLESRGIYLFRDPPATAAAEPHSNANPHATEITKRWPHTAGVAAWLEDHPHFKVPLEQERVDGWLGTVIYVAGDSTHQSFRLTVELSIAPPGEASTGVFFSAGAVDDESETNIYKRREVGDRPEIKPRLLLKIKDLHAVERLLHSTAVMTRESCQRFQRIAIRLSIAALRKHVQENVAHAATELPESHDPFVRLRRYMHEKHRGTLRVAGYTKPFEFRTGDGFSDLCWNNEVVVTFSSYAASGSGAPDSAAISLGNYPAATPRHHLEHVEAKVLDLAAKGMSPMQITATMLKYALDFFQVLDNTQGHKTHARSASETDLDAGVVRKLRHLKLDPTHVEQTHAGLVYNGSVNWSDMGLTKLPALFQRVTGSFYCARNNLVTLDGAPEYVGGDFVCSGNELTSLRGAPKWVDRDFVCFDNNLTTLAHGPSLVEGNLDCGLNRLLPDTEKPAWVKGDIILGTQHPYYADAAAEPQPTPEKHAIDPTAPAYFKAFVGLAGLQGKRISRPGHPWHMRIESTWCPDDETSIQRRMAAAKLTFESGGVKEQISIKTEEHGTVFKIVVGGNHLGSNGRVFLELRADDLRKVTTPTQFLWQLADKLQILNNKMIPDRKSAVEIPERYLDQAVRGYLNAFLALTTDDEHPDYDEASGAGPDLGDNASIDDIDPADRAKAREYMRRFLEHVYPDIAAAEYTKDLNADQVGNDAYLSSGGYGGGFTDRSYDYDLRHKLDRACDAIFPGDVSGSAERDPDGNVTRVHIHF